MTKPYGNKLILDGSEWDVLDAIVPLLTEMAEQTGNHEDGAALLRHLQKFVNANTLSESDYLKAVALNN